MTTSAKRNRKPMIDEKAAAIQTHHLFGHRSGVRQPILHTPGKVADAQAEVPAAKGHARNRQEDHHAQPPVEGHHQRQGPE
jgi:hypothetical protein